MTNTDVCVFMCIILCGCVMLSYQVTGDACERACTSSARAGTGDPHPLPRGSGMTSTFFPSAVYLVLSSRSDRTKVEVHCKCPRAWFNRGHVLYMRRELMRDHLSLGSPRTSSAAPFQQWIANLNPPSAGVGLKSGRVPCLPRGKQSAWIGVMSVPRQPC